MKIKLLFTVWLVVVGQALKAQNTRSQIQYSFSQFDNYAAELTFEGKIAEGVCDCSVGSKKKNNPCTLYAVTMKRILFWVDSTTYTKDELLSRRQILVTKEQEGQIPLGEKVIVTLSNTSSKEYLQLRSILPTVLSKEYQFSSTLAYIERIDCGQKEETFKKGK